LGTRLLEVAQASSIELRNRLRDKRNSQKKEIDNNQNSGGGVAEFGGNQPNTASGGFQMLTTSMLATR